MRVNLFQAETYRQYTTYDEYIASGYNNSFTPSMSLWGDTKPTQDDHRTVSYAWRDPSESNFGLFNTFGLRYGSAKGWSTSNHSAYSYTGLDEKTRSLDFLESLKSVKLITDYAPRMEGSRRYMGSDQPTVDVGYDVLRGGSRRTYRDRHIVLQGFEVSEDFYSPCYRNRPLPDTKDYRRTLYWNPNLELDEKGRANITLWNNSNSTSITVSAEGITPKGKILTGISYPEDR